MSEEEKHPERMKSSDLLSIITGRIGKITALLLALGALVVTAGDFFEIGSTFLTRFNTEGSVKDCFQARMNYPKTVSIDGWQSMHVGLAGRNDCRERLGVHVAFKAKQLSKVRLESPVADCVDPVDTRCWEVKSIEAGAVDVQFIPPHLKVLKKPLGNPVDININWVVYDVDTKKRLNAGAAQIQLTDNP